MVAYDPFSAEVMSDPLPIYRELRAAGAMHRLEAYDAWALPRFAEVWAVSRDRRSFSIAEGPVFARDQLLSPAPPDLGVVPEGPIPSFSMVDPPLHTELRKLLSPPFRPGPVDRLEPRLRSLARAAALRLRETGGGELIRDYFAPVSMAGICGLLGLPDAAEYVALANRFVAREPGRPGLTDDGRAAHAEMNAALAAVVAEVRRTGAGGFIGDLTTCNVQSQPLSDDEIATQLVTLIVGGVETMPKVMAGGVLQLAAHPGQRRRLVAEPGRAADAFDEILRYEVPIQFLGRTALTDVELGGTVVRAGQRVILLYRSANRDEREFPDADRFDIDRRAPRQLGFGTGAHVCIGAHLARLEGTILLQELHAAIPEYEVLTDQVVVPTGEFHQGYSSMPIRAI